MIQYPTQNDASIRHRIQQDRWASTRLRSGADGGFRSFQGAHIPSSFTEINRRLESYSLAALATLSGYRDYEGELNFMNSAMRKYVSFTYEMNE